MKNYTVKYKNGHLIDVATGKRIFLKRGGEFTLLGDDLMFEDKDELTFQRLPLSSSEKYSILQNNYKNYRFVKVAWAGQKFIYRIGLSKMTKEDVKIEYLFDAVIMEDLYIKSKINNKEDSKQDKWSLCDCLCKTTKCIDGDLQMFEEIQGLSLSNLFSNMVAFYFTLQRSGSCNAFNTYFFAEHDNYVLSDVDRSLSKNRFTLESIGDFRKKIEKY